MESNAPETVGPAQSSPASEGTPAEPRGAHFKRRAQRTRLYLTAFALVAAVVCLVALVLANTRSVELSWVFGDTKASLVWIILAAAILGWLLGLATSIMFRRMTRRP
jgi:uncharacterized integral membrane protein